ncbi:hypothetical protein SAMN04488090_4012 [Siphonobacter aquaeclarae]|jgi:hypothetical protein|uniref:Uncharacterized protein n=2 Tax=Siphonobacter aquaeclarae TaxID=563176 RepID=A0A1G9V8R3_9BACT|nr:hypothetical protein SAMN04488090_4012 [Siphonobacter aquaeclarae]
MAGKLSFRNFGKKRSMKPAPAALTDDELQRLKKSVISKLLGIGGVWVVLLSILGYQAVQKGNYTVFILLSIISAPTWMPLLKSLKELQKEMENRRAAHS